MTPTREIWQEIARLYYEEQQTRKEVVRPRPKLVKKNR